jgi:ketosteroid isomerase-like protein
MVDGGGGAGRDPAVQELLDKQAIREVVMRYCRGVDRLDADLVASAYHPDATDERPGAEATGPDIGPDMVASLAASMESTNHQIGTQLIEVHGDTAVAESYSTGSHVLKDGRRLRTQVRYIDTFERRHGEWKISHRLVINDVMDILPPSDVPRMGPPAAGSRDRDDPSYAVFASGAGGA